MIIKNIENIVEIEEKENIEETEEIEDIEELGKYLRLPIDQNGYQSKNKTYLRTTFLGSSSFKVLL